MVHVWKDMLFTLDHLQFEDVWGGKKKDFQTTTNRSPKNTLNQQTYPPKYSKTSLHVDCIAILKKHQNIGAVFYSGYIKTCQLPEFNGCFWFP